MAVSPIKAKECSYKPTREFKINRVLHSRANSPKVDYSAYTLQGLRTGAFFILYAE